MKVKTGQLGTLKATMADVGLIFDGCLKIIAREPIFSSPFMMSGVKLTVYNLDTGKTQTILYSRDDTIEIVSWQRDID